MKSKILSLVVAAFALQAQASLIDYGTYTNDTAAGLDWLDMSFTTGLSYNQVSTSISGGSLSGWRFATLAEFDLLINAAVGAPYVANNFDSAILSQMQSLVSMLGSNFSSDPTNAFTTGMVDSSSLAMANARQFGFSTPDGFVRAAASNYNIPKSSASSDLGSFLVRSAASPVPDTGATLALLGSAFLGLAALRRRFAT